jgi:uncharacterized protein (TIGR02391 family)
MPIEGDLDLDPETIIDLPIETLALAVLQNFSESGAWNRGNWMLAARRALGKGPHLHALAEAWAWLEARTLVAPNFDQGGGGAIRVTRSGRRAVEQSSLAEVQAAERLGLDLHPRLAGTVRPIFLMGDHETAAFKAMKEVEVRVRELAALPSDVIGVPLMRQAFAPEGGPLTDPSHEGGERDARSHLFAGAIGSFKNPTSHRSITYTDPIEASEVVLLADLLMRILDSVEARLEASEQLA